MLIQWFIMLLLVVWSVPCLWRHRQINKQSVETQTWGPQRWDTNWGHCPVPVSHTNRRHLQIERWYAGEIEVEKFHPLFCCPIPYFVVYFALNIKEPKNYS